MNAQCGALHPKAFRKELRKYSTKETVGMVRKIIILTRTPDITYLSYTLPKLGKKCIVYSDVQILVTEPFLGRRKRPFQLFIY